MSNHGIMSHKSRAKLLISDPKIIFIIFSHMIQTCVDDNDSYIRIETIKHDSITIDKTFFFISNLTHYSKLKINIPVYMHSIITTLLKSPILQ